MASSDFEHEKARFRSFYDEKLPLLGEACESYKTLVTALLTAENIAVSKIEARVKDREECIRKFMRKYLPGFEDRQEPYEIAPCITDLVGLRIVCLYGDELATLAGVLGSHFEVISVSNKASEIESTEGLFGYKGLHMDLRLRPERAAMAEYATYAQFSFEIQLRTIIQDSWSVLDHKIKYKKSIPIELKRRINRLAALFELADEEFRSIRVATADALQTEAEVPEVVDEGPEGAPTTAATALASPNAASTPKPPAVDASASKGLNVFSFLRVAQHFFRTYEFEPHKVDGFVQDVLSWQPGMTKGQFNEHMRKTYWRVKQYKQFFENGESKGTMNPFTVIRHCLYLADRVQFAGALSKVVRANFEAWLEANPVASIAS